MKNIAIFVSLAIILFVGADGRRIRRSDDTTEGEKELRRTKRNIYQALLKRKDVTGFVDLATPETTKKPQIARHTREVRFEVLLNHKWRDEMQNRTSPEFKLLSGNMIDAIRNELNADFNYLTSIVMKLRKGNKERVLADIASKFFITEVNPERHLQGVVSRGWISGQSVDPSFFKLIAIEKKTGKEYDPLRSRPVELHIKPASLQPEHLRSKPSWHTTPATFLQNPTATLSSTKSESPTHLADGRSNLTKVEEPFGENQTKPATSSFYLQYKEIDISIKLAQIYQDYLKDKQSPEYQELSGNVEQAVTKLLSSNEFFINCTVIEFSESSDGKVISMMSIKFRHEEKFAIEKCQALIAEGNINGMPVDDHFFLVNYLGETDEQGENIHQLTSVDEKIPQPVPNKYKLKLRPLHYIEIRVSIKINETWNDELSDNQTVRYTVFSGQVEQAVDRSLSDNLNYIDCNVIEFMESTDKEVITNIAVRLYQNETQPEQVVRNMLRNGTLSGIPIDPSFFAVFSISYRIQSPEKSAKELEGKTTEGQKQQAQSTNQSSLDTNNPTATSPQAHPLLSPCQQQQQTAEDAINKGKQIGTFVPQCQSDGTYKQVQCHALTGFCWCVDNAGSRLQGTEQRYKEPFCQGIHIHGNIISNSTLIVPSGSCLTIYVQELITCGDGIDCHVPLAANQTFNNVTSFNNQVLFDFMMPRTKPGTYIISAILNMGWCRSNSLETSKLVHIGDYHTTSNEGFVIDSQTSEVEKTLFVEPITPEEIGINLHGNIILPEGETTASFGPQSCISLETKLLKTCTGRKCGNLPETKNHTINISPGSEQSIPYEVRLIDLDEGTYVISVVIHTKACITEDSQAISDGDFYNEEMQEFTITMDTNDIEKDIPVVKMNDTESGTTISGRVLFPPEITEIGNGSCLTVSSRKLIKCKNNHCKIPPVASKTWEMVEYDNRGIPYSLFLPVSSPGSYLISAVINNGWCKLYSQGVWIKDGDLYNDKVHDFELKSPSQPIGKNIQISLYTTASDDANRLTPTRTLIVNGRVSLPPNRVHFLPPRSCLIIKTQLYEKCANENKCIVGKQVFRYLHLEGNTLPYFVTITNASSNRYVINAILNVDWCSEDVKNKSMKFDDFYNKVLDDLQVTENQTEAECDIQLSNYADNVIDESSTHNMTLVKTATPLTYRPTEEISNSFIGNKAYPIEPVASLNKQDSTNSEFSTLNEMASPYSTTNAFKISTPSINTTSISSVYTTTKSPLIYNITNPITNVGVSNDTLPIVPVSTTVSPDVTLPLLTTNASENQTLLIASNPSVNNTIVKIATNGTTVDTIMPPPPVQEFEETVPANVTQSNDLNMQTSSQKSSPTIVTSSQPSNTYTSTVTVPFPINASVPVAGVDGLVALPKGLPKSCSEIRSSGIGSMDGQYIVEARENCHLSIICQDMEGQNPKEFLGGPSEDEWRYWHFAVLIKISQQDKENIPEGACLEKSERGQDLLRRVLEAGARQDNPINEWKSNLAKLLRSRRNIHETSSIISKAKTIYKENQESNWGVL